MAKNTELVVYGEDTFDVDRHYWGKVVGTAWEREECKHEMAVGGGDVNNFGQSWGQVHGVEHGIQHDQRHEGKAGLVSGHSRVEVGIDMGKVQARLYRCREAYAE